MNILNNLIHICRVDSHAAGRRILNAIEDTLKLRGSLKLEHVEGHQLIVSVNDTTGKHKAADVARLIREKIPLNSVYRLMGVGIADVGAINEDHTQIERIKGDVTYIVLIAAGFAALLVSVLTIWIRKRYDKKRDKLGDLQNTLSGPAETCKDYQDLCRARMTGKGSSSEAPNSSGRVVILNQENDRPPSSRSSTSSWSEEPALTNMDISTGHMVLVSYCISK